MTTRVKIESFDGYRGFARGEDGRSFGFYERACAGIVPKIGAEGWAVLVVTIDGEPEIVLLRPTPDARESDLLLARSNAEEALRQSYFHNDGTAKANPRRERAPLDVVRPYLDVPPGVEELLAPSARERLADRIGGLELADGITLEDFWPTTSTDTGIAFDPCFVPLGGADGDLLGLYVYPPALPEAPIPLAFAYHEQDPSFTWVSESVAHFDAVLAARGITKAKKPGPEAGTPNPLVLQAMAAVDEKPKAGTGVDRERWLVWKIHSSGGLAHADEAHIAELRSLYEALGWRAALAMLEEYVAASELQRNERGEWDRRLTEVRGEVAEYASMVTIAKPVASIPSTLLVKMLVGKDEDAQRRMVCERAPTAMIGALEKRTSGWVIVDEGREAPCDGATFTGFEPAAGDRVLATDLGDPTRPARVFLVSRA